MNLAGMKNVVIEVDPNNKKEIRDAIEYFLESPPSVESCQAAVDELTWDAVGKSIFDCYKKVLANDVVV